MSRHRGHIGTPDGLIVSGRIEGEVPEHLTLVRQDTYIEIGDEHDHRRASVGSADTDVMQPPAVSQRDPADAVDAVPAHPGPFRKVESRSGRPGLVSCLERRLRCHAPASAVGAHLVVAGDERVDLRLERLDVFGCVLFRQVGFERLVEALDLAAGLRVVGARVTVGDSAGEQLGFHDVGAAPVPCREDASVVGEQGCRVSPPSCGIREDAQHIGGADDVHRLASHDKA